MPVLAAVVSIILGLVLHLFSDGSAMEPQWSEPVEAPEKTADTAVTAAQPEGSPVDDETPHTVTVSDFLIDPYETTQKDYVSLMGEIAFAFAGDDLPSQSASGRNTMWN